VRKNLWGKRRDLEFWRSGELISGERKARRSQIDARPGGQEITKGHRKDVRNYKKVPTGRGKKKE